MNKIPSSIRHENFLKYLALISLTIIVHVLIADPFSVISGILKCLY